MVLLEQGINRIRDRVYDDITDGQLGVDGTAVSVSDTGLKDAILGTDYTITKTKFNKGLKLEHQTTAGDLDGRNVRELVINDTNSDSITRVVTPAISGTPTTVLTSTTQLLFIQEL